MTQSLTSTDKSPVCSLTLLHFKTWPVKDKTYSILAKIQQAYLIPFQLSSSSVVKNACFSSSLISLFFFFPAHSPNFPRKSCESSCLQSISFPKVTLSPRSRSLSSLWSFLSLHYIYIYIFLCCLHSVTTAFCLSQLSAHFHPWCCLSVDPIRPRDQMSLSLQSVGRPPCGSSVILQSTTSGMGRRQWSGGWNYHEGRGGKGRRGWNQGKGWRNEKGEIVNSGGKCSCMCHNSNSFHFKVCLQVNKMTSVEGGKPQECVCVCVWWLPWGAGPLDHWPAK